MTKQKKPDTSRNPKAPKAARPEAPFERGHQAPKKLERGRQDVAKKQHNPTTGAGAIRAGVGARISRRAADRLRSGHLWVYASDIEHLEAGEGEGPALVPVADNRGILLGTALYSPTSQIALRMVSREEISEKRLADVDGGTPAYAMGRRKSPAG